MPIKVWMEDAGSLVSSIKTNWDITLTREEHRRSAESLDRAFDRLLDGALEAVATLGSDHSDSDSAFVRAYGVGSVLRDFDPAAQPQLAREPERFVYWALATKCRLGARSDGTRDNRWRRELRPTADEPPRREGRRNDHFQMCQWLAQQPYEDASMLFGASVRNVWQMMERPTLKPLILRQCLADLLRGLEEEDRLKVTSTTRFPELMKALRSRWPARGFGSAKQPAHYGRSALAAELDPLVRGFVARD